MDKSINKFAKGIFDRILCQPIKDNFRFFCFISLVSVFSNSLIMFTGLIVSYEKALFANIGYTIIISYAFVLLIHSLSPLLKKIAKYLIVSGITVLFCVELFLLLNFNMIISSSVIETLSCTNTEECSDFIGTYFNRKTGYLAIFIVVLYFLIIKATNIFYKLRNKTIIYALICFFLFSGLGCASIAVFRFVKYNNAGKLCFHSTLSRLVVSYFIFKSEQQNIVLYREGSLFNGECESSNTNLCVVLVIGESFSKYHSSLYGYEKDTNPRLAARSADENLCVYTDVITSADMTYAVLESIFQLRSPVLNTTSPKIGILFPAIFKQAGYKTYCFSNQYTANKPDNFFLSDKEVSNNLFDYRNTKTFPYDMDMVNSIALENDPLEFYIVHLAGQHYVYAKKYPPHFAKFTSDDYPNMTDKKNASIVAHYDNSIRYNDSVIDELIKKFQDKEAILIYLSDHGEEVYDYRNYMGHGNAAFNNTDLKYQIDIPFMIWVSDRYKKNHPEKVIKIRDSRNRPFVSSNLPYLLLDLADIDIKGLSLEKSVINDRYDTHAHRKTLGTVDYDEWKKKHH